MTKMKLLVLSTSIVFLNDFDLEGEYREEKVASETRIPAGSYKVGLLIAEGFLPERKKVSRCSSGDVVFAGCVGI